MTSIKEMVEALSKTEETLDISMPSLGIKQDDTLAGSKNYQYIKDVLHAEPLLVEACASWLQEKLGQIAQAKLDALYSPEQQQAIRERMRQQ